MVWYLTTKDLERKVSKKICGFGIPLFAFEIIVRKMSTDAAEKVKEGVKAYYGKKLKTSDDLQTNACKLGDKQMTPAVKSALKLIHDEVASK